MIGARGPDIASPNMACTIEKPGFVLDSGNNFRSFIPAHSPAFRSKPSLRSLHLKLKNYGRIIEPNNEARPNMAFSKGRSANPDGRKVEAKIKRAARAEGEKCVAALAAVRDDNSVAPEMRAKAAFTLLDLAKWNGRHSMAPSAPRSIALENV